MKMKNKIIAICIIMVLLTISIVYAGDNLYHFMQAHQDYLVIGKVTDIKGEKLYEIQVSELITESSIRKDIPKKIVAEIETGLGIWEIQKGDNIAISLNKRGGGYKLENGVYKITTDDTDTLEVISSDKPYINNELAAVELFLKSRGKIKDFSFVEYKTYVHKDPGNISVEDICIYTMENGKMLPTEYEKNEKYIIENEKVSIKMTICLILIFVVAQIIALFVYLKLNPKCKLLEILKYKENNQKD